jgi:riboflavin synthase alpha subunit
VRETLDRTSLGDLAAGSRVNLERALRADGRLDGHIVQGHVDGTGRVRALERRADDVRLAVDCPPELAGSSWRRARSPSTASR